MNDGDPCAGIELDEQCRMEDEIYMVENHFEQSFSFKVKCVCVHACVRACVRVCVSVCVCACVCVSEQMSVVFV